MDDQRLGRGVIDCLVKVLECPKDGYETWVGLLPQGEARRKMSGLLTFGEIHIDANHAGMLGKAFAQAMPHMDEPYRGWSAALMEQLAAIQQDINTMGELFVNTVARNRGISAKVIKSTQAACFMAADGVEIGLADEVCPPDAAFKNLLEKTGA